MRDVAEVSWETTEERYVGRYNGERAVFVTANQKDGYNILKCATGSLAGAGVRAELPKECAIERGFDQSQRRHRLDRLSIDFAIAIALVTLTLLPLGLRAADGRDGFHPAVAVVWPGLLYFQGSR